jgi:hypothetical protein
MQTDHHFECRPPFSCPCGCGNEKRQQCTESGLRNHQNFTPFADLQDKNKINEDCCCKVPETGQFSPTQQWALIGKITENAINPV